MFASLPRLRIIMLLGQAAPAAILPPLCRSSLAGRDASHGSGVLQFARSTLSTGAGNPAYSVITTVGRTAIQWGHNHGKARRAASTGHRGGARHRPRDWQGAGERG